MSERVPAISECPQTGSVADGHLNTRTEMKANVRRFISPDVDLDGFRPDDPDDFSFRLQALVGPADGPGEESFEFLVRTPRSLIAQVEEEQPVFGRSLVIVGTSDIGRILARVRSAIEGLEASSWKALTRMLAPPRVSRFAGRGLRGGRTTAPHAARPAAAHRYAWAMAASSRRRNISAASQKPTTLQSTLLVRSVVAVNEAPKLNTRSRSPRRCGRGRRVAVRRGGARAQGGTRTAGGAGPARRQALPASVRKRSLAVAQAASPLGQFHYSSRA
jgi:hypothetical protein